MNASYVAGAACFPPGANFSSPGDGTLVPCNNTPPLLNTIFAANKWPAAFGLLLDAPVAGVSRE